MSKPVKPGADEAAEYVLGLLGQEDSRAFAQRLKSDEALRAQVEYWEGMFSDLPAEQSEPPPSGMFEKILDRIEGEGADLPGTVTRRAGVANWHDCWRGKAPSRKEFWRGSMMNSRQIIPQACS